MFVCVHLSLYHVGTHECVHVFLWWHHFVFFLRQDLTLAWRSLSRWGCLGCEPQGFRTSPPSHRWDYTYILIHTGFCCPCHCLFSMDSGTHTPVLTLAQQTLQQPSYLSIPEWSHNLLSLLEHFFHLCPFMPMWFVPAWTCMWARLPMWTCVEARGWQWDSPILSQDGALWRLKPNVTNHCTVSAGVNLDSCPS